VKPSRRRPDPRGLVFEEGTLDDDTLCWAARLATSGGGAFPMSDHQHPGEPHNEKNGRGRGRCPLVDFSKAVTWQNHATRLSVCREIARSISWFPRLCSALLVGHGAPLCSASRSLIGDAGLAELDRAISRQTLRDSLDLSASAWASFVTVPREPRRCPSTTTTMQWRGGVQRWSS